MRRMTRRRKFLLWFAFAAIPLLVIVLAVALSPGTNQAQRQMKKIQPGMTGDQVRAVLGMERPGTGWTLEPAWQRVEWEFPDGSAICVTFDQTHRAFEWDETHRVSEGDEFIRNPPWYARLRDRLRK